MFFFWVGITHHIQNSKLVVSWALPGLRCSRNADGLSRAGLPVI